MEFFKILRNYYGFRLKVVYYVRAVRSFIMLLLVFMSRKSTIIMP